MFLYNREWLGTKACLLCWIWSNWRKWLLIGVSAISAYFLVAAFNDG